ncbi:MAG: amidoligase family protein [Alphaproteobacteria bacterium]|nr:amidoligase family protein [Alphaproteobacteria bacterium]
MKTPPLTNNYDGNERKVGLEIEYSNVPLSQAATIVKDLFGGEIEEITDAIFKVLDTEFGDFVIELDAIPLQKIAESTRDFEGKVEESVVDELGALIGRAAGKVGEKIAPFEIVAPPIAISDLPKMERLREELAKAGAEDTKQSFRNAFGLHINPEVAALDSKYITRHIQSFLLLAPWLIKAHNIDLTRRLTNFIDPFPISYLELVLDMSYSPDLDKLIRDYHDYNPTRNRALDMLPLFKFINQALVTEFYGTEEKINKRPTFHYRLPNCELANARWSFSLEWARWLIVEELAYDEEKLFDLVNRWQNHQAQSFPLESDWVEQIDQQMQAM